MLSKYGQHLREEIFRKSQSTQKIRFSLIFKKIIIIKRPISVISPAGAPVLLVCGVQVPHREIHLESHIRSAQVDGLAEMGNRLGWGKQSGMGTAEEHRQRDPRSE